MIVPASPIADITTESKFHGSETHTMNELNHSNKIFQHPFEARPRYHASELYLFVKFNYNVFTNDL